MRLQPFESSVLRPQSSVGRIALCLLILFSSAARADTVVSFCSVDGSGGPGNSNLDTALAAGGRVTFSCGAHATIRITRTHDIGSTTEIYGNGAIVLDAENAHSIFRLTSPSAVLRLNGLTIRRGRPAGAPDIAGVVYAAAQGTVELVHTRIENSTNPIYMTGGTVRATDSEIADSLGIAITSRDIELTRTRIHGFAAPPMRGSGGSVSIRDSEIYGSDGSSFFDCQLRIEGSRFTANGRFGTGIGDGGPGGAIYTTCDTTILESNFVNNKGSIGGAIYVRDAGRLLVRGTRFTGNEARDQGGAIGVSTPWEPSRTLTLQHVTFADNRAKAGGAVHLGTAIENATVLEGTAVLFERNIAAETGGAIAGTNAGLRLARAVFNGNRAGQSGGAIALTHFAPRSVILANALLIGNVAPTGSVYRGSGIRFVNSTIANNQGVALAPFWPSASPTNPPDSRLVRLVNTLMVGNQGGGCGPGPFHVLFADGGRNMQFPSGDCGSSIPVTDPRLDEFYVPLATGPATGAGDLKSCTTAPVNGVDVYGQRRPQGKGCTIGAVEGDIEDLLRHRLRGREGRRRPPRGRENDSGPASSRIDTILKFREARERGDLEAARGFLVPDARIWFDMAERQGPGQPWRLGEGYWDRWDRFFHSERDTTDWKDLRDRVTAIGHETNDYYRLLDWKPSPLAFTWWLDSSGKITGFLFHAIRGPAPDRNRLKEFEVWARKNRPAELAYLMPKGKIDPSGDRPKRWRAILIEWRRATGLPDVPVMPPPSETVR